MKISDKGLALIAKWEGFRAEPYNDPAGHATIGYGHLLHRGPVTVADRKRWGALTRQEGLKLLRQDVAIFEAAVNDAVKVKLTQGQFDALVSFTFNLGGGALRGSTLLKLVNSKRFESAADEFGKWVYADGKRLQGLANRRADEELLFRSAGDPEDARKHAAWQARLDKIRRVADKRRKAGKTPVWTLGMRLTARIYKQLLNRR